MSEENRRELEPRFYRAVGATGPQSEKAFPALARRREKNIEDKFADSQEIAKKVESFYRGTSPNQVITENLTSKANARDDNSERVSGVKSSLSAKTAAILILVLPLIVGLIDVLVTGRIGIITSLAYSITLLYLATTINMRNAWDPVIAGPVAYLIVTLILGQLTLGSAGSFMLQQVAMILTTLAFNAPWIVGATVIAFVIALRRIRRSA